MMHRNEKFYHYLDERVQSMSERWYELARKETHVGVYASDDADVIAGMKRQNADFIRKVNEIFIKDEETLFAELEGWLVEVTTDEEHFRTPLHVILQEFHRNQTVFTETLTEYFRQSDEAYSHEEMLSLYETMHRTYRKVIAKFVKLYMEYSDKRLRAQQELILELSSPVIYIRKGVALLPLVGDIDTQRSKFILENTLSESARLGIRHLFLDLSGVVVIDTMVAQHLFQLIEALRLLGVKTTLSGIRPEIAQTAVQLGVSFEDIDITPSLSIALDSIFNQ